jgi:coenzyme F420-reducing hydrogenase beta subunit
MCEVACPHKAVRVSMNSDGFYQPFINEAKCIDCGICTKVCYKYLEKKNPFENAFKEKQIYGAWSKDVETVNQSSSGGVGYELSKYCFEKGYKVCGVTLDAPNNRCKHIIANSNNDLDEIRTSKYLQSYTVEAFSQFKKGEKYLVIGCPCQIYGLRQWLHLKTWEDNFILVDFFCHGTPSFNLWKKYKLYIEANFKIQKELEQVNFRAKYRESRWHKNAISIRDISGNKYIKHKAFADDLFFRFFLNNSCLNEACYQCKLRLDLCSADIRIADFWGKKYSSNDTGVSLVVINTEKGKQIFDKIRSNLMIEKCNFADLKDSQSVRFFPVHRKREVILKELKGKKTLNKIYFRHFGGILNLCKKKIANLKIKIIKRIRPFVPGRNDIPDNTEHGRL